jgi:hypothetical protein
MALILKEDPTNVSREMAKLEELGILRSKRNGNLKHFQANQACPFFEELKGLILKTVNHEGRGKWSLKNWLKKEGETFYASAVSMGRAACDYSALMREGLPLKPVILISWSN